MGSQTTRVRPGTWTWAVIGGVVAYFALLLVPTQFPGFAGTDLFVVYGLSLPLVLLVLLTVGMWGGAGLLRSRARGQLLRPHHRAFVLVGGVGIASFALVLGLTHTLPQALPTGSHLRRFDRVVWQDPHSAEYVEGDITPRQKMLADVVRNVLPGRTRADLEKLLGTPLETGYFEETGRDLIYLLGPQRDSFLAIDSEWLLIWLDKNGRFERYEIATD